MKILVTGNNGYIGTVLTEILYIQGFDVVGLDNNYFEQCNLTKVNNLSNKIVKQFINKYRPKKINYYGSGDSDKKFIKVILQKKFWNISSQKFFSDK